MTGGVGGEERPGEGAPRDRKFESLGFKAVVVGDGDL